MAFGHGFRGKQETVAQENSPPIAGNSIWAAWSEDRFMLDHRRGKLSPHRTHSRARARQHRQAGALGCIL
jgi:hypothetical protein